MSKQKRQRGVIYAVIAALLFISTPTLTSADDAQTASSTPPLRVPPKVIYGQYSRHFVASLAWPSTISPQQKDGFNFCVVGAESEVKLPPATKWRLNVPLVVVDANDRDDAFVAANCHAVFIGLSQERRLSSIIGSIGRLPVLTISPIEGFVSRGGMFGLIYVGESIRFTINRKAIEASGLRIVDPRVLDLAVPGGKS